MAPTAQSRRPGAGSGDGIVTPEAVVLEFADAGLGSRALAFLVDLVVRFLALWAIFTGVALFVPLLTETAAIVVVSVVMLLLLLVYPVVFETFWNGRTIGKYFLGLRVVTVEGAPVRFGHTVIRAALGLVDFWLTLGIAAIGFGLATRHNQRLGDLAAGTIVIRERQAGAHAQPIVFEPPPGWAPYVAGLDVTALSDGDYVLVRSFLLRIHELRPAAAEARAEELATAIADRLGVRRPPGHPPLTFLIAVASAYQSRHGGPQAGAPGARWGAASPGEIPPPVWQEDQPAATWGT